MPRQELQYPKQPFSTVKRLGDRGKYDLETIHRIVNSCRMLHVSFNDPDSPFPAVLPMIGQMGSFERPSADVGDVLDLYLHGYVSSRIMNLTRKTTTSPDSPSASLPNPSLPTTSEEGLPLTISATHVDGLVLALTPNHHSYNYRSAVLFGYATLVVSPAEKLYAMELITDGIVPSRWRSSRVPPTGAEMQSTSILRVKIAAGSAKVRSGGPHDDRHDVENDAVTGRVWAGTVPVWTALGEPVPGEGNKVAEVPGYLRDFVRGENEEGRRFAEEAVKEEGTGK